MSGLGLVNCNDLTDLRYETILRDFEFHCTEFHFEGSKVERLASC